MKLTKTQLRKLIKEQITRLDELYDGSMIGSYLKQSIAKVWEADNLIQKALGEANNDDEHQLLTMIHNSIEKLAYALHDKAESVISGSSKPKAPRKLPQAPKRNV